jgi:putative MATE family efflux protein
VLHALILAAVLGACFAALDWACAAGLFALLGGRGAALERALSYSHVLFSGAVAIWASAFLAALLRGSGDSVTPARVGLLASIAYVPLSGILTLGLADWPGFGVAGSAIASLVVATGTTLALAGAIGEGRLGFVVKWDGLRLQWRIFREILRVGILGSITTLIASLTAVLMIGLAGRFGVAALAGYGIGARLEYMIAPVAFGIGSGLTTLVGVAAGAEAWQRAARVAWTGGLIAFLALGSIGWLVSLFPEAWSRLFSADEQVVAASVSYIRHVAPFYCLFGLGVSLNFASQGAGRMLAPLMASFARMAAATIIGWIVVERTSFGLDGLFSAIAFGIFVYGCGITLALFVRPWRAKGGA